MTVRPPIADAIPHGLSRARYEPELRSRRELETEDSLRGPIDRARLRHGAAPLRRSLLADAIRVNERVLPDVAASLRDVSQRAGLDLPIETYVTASPHINAAVVPWREHLFVFLSSAAVENLDRDELDFVVGHELGHAAFDHVGLPAEAIVAADSSIPARLAMRLLAWQRQAEIAADRAGLVCCGSLDAAAGAMFKCVSGLARRGVRMEAHELAAQWPELAAELARDVRSDHWRATHPFPPLRMRAMLAFHEAGGLEPEAGADSDAESDVVGGALAAVDRQIQDMLGMVDPLAREQRDGDEQASADPMLREQILLMGLAVATASGEASEQDQGRLAAMVGAPRLHAALADPEADSAGWRARFDAARAARAAPLTAIEMQRILSALAPLVHGADGEHIASRTEVVQDLAESLGIAPGYVRRVLEQAAAAS